MRYDDFMGQAGRSTPLPPRLIRRYANRKLYDPAAARYVTIEELGAFVAGGGDIDILDQQSGEDVTSQVLAQVLLEGLRRSTARIPRQVLTRLVRLAAGPQTRWGEWPDPHEVAGRAWDEAERIVGRILARGGLTLEDALSLRADLGDAVHRLVTDAQAGIEGRLRAVLGRRHGPAGRSLEGLRSRLDTLEAHFNAPTRRRARTTRSRRPPRRGQRT
jgi:polyhydroxyalkanoate synthesis repressor PhaR